MLSHPVKFVRVFFSDNDTEILSEASVTFVYDPQEVEFNNNEFGCSSVEALNKFMLSNMNVNFDFSQSSSDFRFHKKKKQTLSNNMQKNESDF